MTSAASIVARLFVLLTQYRDPYENHHGPQTASIAQGLAEAVNIEPLEIALLKIAAQIHDLGKLVVPEHILNKTGRITKAEHAMVHAHTRFGHEIASSLSMGPLIEDVLLHHHENYDGTGYPDTLIGEKISIHARIVRVADVYDALTNDRPYRKAYSAREAIAVMENEGHKFDPHLLNLLRRKVTNWTATLSR